LRVESLSHGCFIGDDHLDGLTPRPAPAAARRRWSASMPRSQSSSRRSDLLPENLTYVLTFNRSRLLARQSLRPRKWLRLTVET
jgi:hypothetical protein